MTPHFLRLLGAAALLAAGPLGAAGTLVERSPFIPDDFVPRDAAPAANVAAPPPQAALLEMRGVYELGGEFTVYLFDLRTQKGEWVTVGQAGQSFRVTAWDTATQTVTVNAGGQQQSVTLKKPSDTPMAVAGAPAPGSAPAQATIIRSTGAAVGPPTPINPASAPPIPRRRRVIVPEANQDAAAAPPPAASLPTPQTPEQLLQQLNQQNP